MAKSTPWGPAQQTTIILRGVTLVSTAGHGGMMVTALAAKKYLSEAAIAQADMHQGSYCYEEDDLIDIPLFDSIDIRKAFSELSWQTRTEEVIAQSSLKSLSRYHSEYLLAVGVEPDPIEYKKHKLRLEWEVSYKNKSAATFDRADNDFLLDTVVRVHLCDGNTVFATKASLDAIYDDEFKCLSKLASELVIVEVDLEQPLQERFTNHVLRLQDSYHAKLLADPETDKKEQDGLCYGYRKRLNGTINSLIERLTIGSRSFKAEGGRDQVLGFLSDMKAAFLPEFAGIEILAQFDG